MSTGQQTCSAAARPPGACPAVISHTGGPESTSQKEVKRDDSDCLIFMNQSEPSQVTYVTTGESLIVTNSCAADGAAGLAAGVAGEECEVPFVGDSPVFCIVGILDHLIHGFGFDGLFVGDLVVIDLVVHCDKIDILANVDPLDR